MIKTATKAMYAMVGAPVVAYEKTVALSGKLTEAARSDYDAAASKGEEVTKRMTATADEIGARMDLEGIQDRVEKLRDQLEDALTQWRDSFRPGDAAKVEKPAPAAKPAAKKPAAAAKKPAAKKPAAAAKKPAAKKPATAAKKPAATAAAK